MFEVFGEEKVITACMLASMALSIFVRVFLGGLYRNMIRETDNMATTENRFLKQCKMKFQNCFELCGRVSNIPVFVDRSLNRLSFGPFSFEVLYHFSGQAMLLSVFFSGLGVLRSIIRGGTLGDILPFYIVSFLGLYLYFSVSTAVDIRGKRQVLKINLVDYLENHLSPRINVTRQDMEMLYGESRTEREKRIPGTDAETGKAEGNGKAAADAETERAEKNGKAEELEALLKEFLTT